MKKLVTIIATLLLSLPLVAQEATSVPSPYQQAQQALKEGRYSDVESWYNHLSKKEKRTPANLTLAIVAATNCYNMELAEERMSLYNSLKLRNEERVAQRDEVEKHLEKVSRLLSNTRSVGTTNIQSGTLEELLKKIQTATPHLGATSATTFITPDGKTKWQVSINQDSLPAFEVVHKLGDGRWDEINTDIISIRGLPEGAILSYPFLLSDGNTLYFSVEQEGIIPTHTLGGKDVYVSRYDRDVQALLVPTQLSLPFNSASDDFAYIVDEQSDYGWLITSRDCTGDTLRLYEFIPSTLSRYEGEEGQANVARWHNPKLSERTYHAPAGIGREGNQPILFWVGKQPIRYMDDLPNTQAKIVFKQYLQVQQSITDTEKALSTLREKLQSNPNLLNDLRIREQILAYEQRMEDYRTKLKALRNEVIGLSFPNHK